jgi:hypothetical protein
MIDDPFAVLGLGPDAGVADIVAARRRLAKAAHPDLGGDPRRMQEVNDAAARAVAIARAAAFAPSPAPSPAPPTAPSSSPPRATTATGAWSRQLVHDHPSFTIEALPAESFEALLVVATWIGDVLVDDPPYLLEVHLREPVECWCRLDLLPEAGSSSVGITAAAIEGDDAPDVDAIRDTWVRALNELDWDDRELRPQP